MASKRLKKKKQASVVFQKQHEPEKNVTKENITADAERTMEEAVAEPKAEKVPECESQSLCFEIEADLRQEEMEEMKAMNFYIQWNGREFCQTDIVEQIRKQWNAMGNTPESLEKLNIYLKPEEAKAYYVANDSVQGCVEL